MKLIDTLIDIFFAMKRSTRAAVITALAVFAVVLIVASEDRTQGFSCDNGGLSVVVRQETDNSTWLIAEKYCTGNVAAATDALVERYGDTLYPGQIIKLP